jgi:gliding motility-associated-like protein
MLMNALRLSLILGLICCSLGSLSAVDYYWVGGSGNWSDISHWATASGGTTFHSVAPTADDNVFFDANSFTGPNQVVTVNNDNIFCRDMDWTGATGNPTLLANRNRVLNVFGSLTLQANMTFDFAGDVTLSGTEGDHNVDMAGHPFQQSLYIEGGGATWTLQSDLEIDSLLQFRAGTFITDGNAITLAYIEINSTGLGHLIDFNGSEVLITGADYTINFNQLVPTFDLVANPGNVAAADATFRFNGPNVTIDADITAPGLELGNVSFESPVGRANIQERDLLELRFGELSFANNGRLLTPMRMNVLTLGPGRTYNFLAGGEFAFTNQLVANGDCGNPISLFSTQPGSEATFVYDNAGPAPLDLQYVSLKDIHATDPGVPDIFNVIEGVDLGNTTGWTITPKTSDQLFWVGGTGMWDDPANWAFTSGGAGGACVPTAGDDVIFDANSFNNNGQVVMVNVENAFCRSMIWDNPTGVPVLLGTEEKQIHFYGDLQLSADMDYRFQGDLYFESLNQDTRIRTSGHEPAKDVYFRSSTGGWVLDDAFRVVNDIYFQSGSLNTNDQDVRCFRFYSETQNPRTLELTTSLIQQDGPYGTNANFDGTNLTFDAGTSRWQFVQNGNINLRESGSLRFHWVEFISGGGFYNSAQNERIYADSIRSGYWTFFGSRINIGYAELAPTQVHQIQTGDTLTIDTLVIPGTCDAGPAELRSNTDDQTAYIRATRDNVLQNLIVKDVHSIGTGTMNDQNGVDLGNTDGWVFTNREPRTLYWVGGEGDWEDTAHWSLSSGGPGGECIPTPVDDVIFDANSFSAPNQQVNASIGVESFCHDMTWEGVTQTPSLRMWSLNCFGSIELIDDMEANFTHLRMRSVDMDETLSLFAKDVFFFNLFGSGGWILTSPLDVTYFNFENGNLQSNGEPVRMRSFSAYQGAAKTIDFQGSHWTFHGSRSNFDYFTINGESNLTIINDDEGLLEATSTDPQIDLWDSMNGKVDLLFSNLEGVSTINQRQGAGLASEFGSVEFRNDGIIYADEMYMDTLLLAAGKAYQLQANGIFYIEDYLQVIGNNCTPIQLSSTSQGTQSEIRMDDGFVKADFVQMRDQRAAGADTEFLAGVHSTNIGMSNTGWIFESRREFENEGFLGEDKVLCRNETITLDANNFSPGETYRWSDGTTDSTFITDQPGVFWAEVTFTNNCVIRDSVEVLEPDSFAPDLPGDTLLCEGEQLLLEPSRELVGLTFEWQDGSEEPTFLVEEEGSYKVTLTLNGCTASDSLNVNFQTAPTIDIGAPQTLCFGESLTLDAGTGADSYTWQDNTTGPTYEVTQAGTYRVSVVQQACTVEDSVVIDYFDPIPLDLGPDTTVCADEVVVIDASVAGATYSWQDGTTNAAYGAIDAGVYTVTVSLNGCDSTDAVEVFHRALPAFELGPDTTICEGESITFDGTVDMNTTYQWSTGTTDPVETVSTEGMYSLTATRDGCAFEDMINLTVQRLPEVNLGADQTACEGETITLDASFPNSTFEWQDGTTTATYDATATGTYEVTTTLAGCSASDAVTLTFTPLPAFELGNDTLLCEGESLLLDASVPGGTYSWQDGTTTATYTVAQGGTFTVEVTAMGCSTSDQVTVSYPQFPDDLLPADQILCEGEVFPINLSVPNGTYLWQDGQTTPNYQISEDGTYSVVASVGRCTMEDALTVVFNPVPTFNLGSDTIICEDQTISLTIDAVADSYSWSTGSTESSITTNTAGQITATAQLDNCSFTDNLILDVQQKTNLDLGLDTTFCEDQGYRLQVNVGGDRFVWQDGSNGPSYEVEATGRYSVQVFDRQCVMSDSITLTSRECYRFQSYIPTAFSPDGQEPNNTFRPFFPSSLQIQSYQIDIMDRWGNIVFSSSDPNAEWDGTCNGDQLPIGVYAYVIQIEYQDDYRSDDEVIIGDVAIIR